MDPFLSFSIDTNSPLVSRVGERMKVSVAGVAECYAPDGTLRWRDTVYGEGEFYQW